MRALFTSFCAAVLASSLIVTSAPVPQDIGDALVITNADIINIQFNAAEVDWSKINWASVFSAEQAKKQIASTSVAQPQQQQQQQAVVHVPASTPAPVAVSTEQSSSAPEPVYESPTPSPSPAPSPAPAPATSAAPAPEPQETQVTQPSGGSSSSGNGNLWGLTYSPYNTDGSCPDVGTVAAQLKKVAAVTNNIRLYSTDCSQLNNVLQAIAENNIALDVHAGIWTSDGASRMQADLDQFVAAVKKFGSGSVKGVSVGNEEISKGVSEGTIIGNIKQVRARLQAEGLGGIPVYTTEQDATFTSGMAEASDLVQINVYSIFDGSYSNIDASVQSVIQRANNVKSKVAGGKPVRFGESGWSSAGNTGPSPLSLANEIAYAKKFKCAAAAAGFDYFYFEAKNAQWKKGAVESEQNFGIFDAGFTPKFDFGLLNSC